MQKSIGQPDHATPGPLDWDDIRYFVELARQERLSAAARTLAVEHSTVSRRIGTLEARLGLRLFDRLPKRWVLTAEGEQLLAYAHRVEDEALSFARAGMGAGSVRGVVKVSAPPALAASLLIPKLAALRARWPAITLEIIAEVRQANLYRREADLALRLLRPEEPGLAGRPLAQMGYGLYAAPGWFTRPDSDWEFIGYGEAMKGSPQQAWLDKFAAGRPYAFWSNDAQAMLAACRAGLGVSLLPHFLGRDAGLALHPDHTQVLSRPIWLVVHPDVRRSPRVTLVAELLAELLEQSGTALL
ncbi:Glycine cleavage system transcriptional activator [Massilia sp. Bi118]|uniref:LysR family transcriptional regulator n=1 Tax=Massilia sp. Bi118 TaxID=2822346 RepID=UPI001D41C312|nr:LysR family transcriptional regulator [Massilia sp. Bi118]CAH0207749.1 Glycine cleavage system transcriptional activator [Massilia sp. Bi118]